jgi:hypothetical protein
VQDEAMAAEASQDKTPRPTSAEDLSREAEERPKSLRLLPRITADALRIVWRRHRGRWSPASH